jgi:hypothetical protein
VFAWLSWQPEMVVENNWKVESQQDSFALLSDGYTKVSATLLSACSNILAFVADRTTGHSLSKKLN